MGDEDTYLIYMEFLDGNGEGGYNCMPDNLQEQNIELSFRETLPTTVSPLLTRCVSKRSWTRRQKTRKSPNVQQTRDDHQILLEGA